MVQKGDSKVAKRVKRKGTDQFITCFNCQYDFSHLTTAALSRKLMFNMSFFDNELTKQFFSMAQATKQLCTLVLTDTALTKP